MSGINEKALLTEPKQLMFEYIHLPQQFTAFPKQNWK